MKQVLITTSTFAVVDRSPLDRLEAAGLDVRQNPFGRRLTRDEILHQLTSDPVVGLVAGLEPLDRGVLEASQLKVVSRVGSGVSNVDLEAAADLGIVVHTTPDGPTSAVAELTVGALLCLLREIHLLDRDLQNGAWNKRTGGQIEGRTILIVGFGRIGRRVASLVEAFGAEVIVYDPFVGSSSVRYPVLSLEDALGAADVASFHLSGDDCVLGMSELEHVRPGMLLLNAARGGVISEEALLAGLESGAFGGAWLDVFSDEPYSGPLIGHPRVLLTPHVGSYTAECRSRMETDAVENLLSVLEADDS